MRLASHPLLPEWVAGNTISDERSVGTGVFQIGLAADRPPDARVGFIPGCADTLATAQRAAPEVCL